MKMIGASNVSRMRRRVASHRSGPELMSIRSSAPAPPPCDRAFARGSIPDGIVEVAHQAFQVPGRRSNLHNQTRSCRRGTIAGRFAASCGRAHRRFPLESCSICSDMALHLEAYSRTHDCSWFAENSTRRGCLPADRALDAAASSCWTLARSSCYRSRSLGRIAPASQFPAKSAG